MDDPDRGNAFDRHLYAHALESSLARPKTLQAEPDSYKARRAGPRC